MYERNGYQKANTINFTQLSGKRRLTSICQTRATFRPHGVPMNSQTDANASITSSAGPVMKPNYPRNLWWFAARSEEITRKPIGMWLLDEPIVFYRKEDRAVVALDNRCPHRWAPLSEGKVDGDNIVCPYHGFQYAPTGQCVKIPSQPMIPAKCRVKSYATCEKDTLIWIWMGDPAQADPQKIPLDSGWLCDPAWSVINGFTTIDANYELLKENILDLTHIPHVHAMSIGAMDWTQPPQVETTDSTVTYRQVF